MSNGLVVDDDKGIVDAIGKLLARNSPIALAISVLSFPNKPIIALALALVIGPELLVLLIISSILLRERKKLLK